MKSYQCVTGTLLSGPHSMAEVLGLFQLAEQARKLVEGGVAVPGVDSHTLMDAHARKLHGSVLLIIFIQSQFLKHLYSVNTCILMYFKKLEMHL